MSPQEPAGAQEMLGMQDPMSIFLYAIRADETRRQYTSKLKAFFDYTGLEGTLGEQSAQFVVKAAKDATWAMISIMGFINYLKGRIAKKEITEATLRNYYKPIRLFCEMNDIQLGWKKIAKGIPRAKNAGNDRAPTIEELRALLGYPDRRMKPIVCTMVSSGIRLGAWDYLRWGDIEPIARGQGVVAAKIIVYRGEADEYFSFISREAYMALKDWMDFRASSGENIKPQSWLMRDIWNAEHYHHGFITSPEKLKSTGIKRLIERALWTQGIRKPLADGQKRHDFKADHGFRKYFKTRTEQVMRPINVEILMGHSTGISDSYYKPRESEILEDYLKALELLLIDESDTLREQVTTLTDLVETSRRVEIKAFEEMDAMRERYDKKLAEMEEHIRLLLKWSNYGKSNNGTSPPDLTQGGG